jgi:hypothetical protein
MSVDQHVYWAERARDLLKRLLDRDAIGNVGFDGDRSGSIFFEATGCFARGVAAAIDHANMPSFAGKRRANGSAESAGSTNYQYDAIRQAQVHAASSPDRPV